MLINFEEMPERTAPGMSNGTGEITVKMFYQPGTRIISYKIHPGGSIGMHLQEKSDDINYVLSGKGKAVCDGVEEELSVGCCHICPKGSEHSIINIGEEDLVMLAVVVEQ